VDTQCSCSVARLSYIAGRNANGAGDVFIDQKTVWKENICFVVVELVSNMSDISGSLTVYFDEFLATDRLVTVAIWVGFLPAGDT